MTVYILYVIKQENEMENNYYSQNRHISFSYSHLHNYITYINQYIFCMNCCCINMKYLHFSKLYEKQRNIVSNG